VGQDWNLGTGFSIAENVAIYDDSANGNLSQSKTFTSGKKYNISFEIKSGSGSIAFLSSNGATTYVGYATYGIGTHSVVFDYTTGSGFGIFASSFLGGAFSITNISVIEITDDTNLPRINYEGGCGSWLFEPQSTNLVPYSEDFTQSNWIKHAAVVLTSGQLSPDGGNNAYKLQGTIGSSFLLDGGFSAITPQSRSIYMRADTNGVIYTLGDSQSNQINVTTEWQRFELQETSNAFYAVDFRGVGVTLDTVYIWGAQVEQQSYATSYIPTSGSSVTRNQDVCTNGGSLATINSTEGVLYAEIAALSDDLTFRSISLNDGSTDNFVTIRYRTSSNRIQVIVFSGGVLQFSNSFDVTNILDFNKVAISYNQSNFNYWVNGVKRANSTSGNTPVGLNKLSFTRGSSSNYFYGKTKALAVWKEALSDSELQSLTTI
jgi:hypothetical protein